MFGESKWLILLLNIVYVDFYKGWYKNIYLNIMCFCYFSVFDSVYGNLIKISNYVIILFFNCIELFYDVIKWEIIIINNSFVE